jgi:hypothetical protein
MPPARMAAPTRDPDTPSLTEAARTTLRQRTVWRYGVNDEPPADDRRNGICRVSVHRTRSAPAGVATGLCILAAVMATTAGTMIKASPVSRASASRPGESGKGDPAAADAAANAGGTAG